MWRSLLLRRSTFPRFAALDPVRLRDGLTRSAQRARGSRNDTESGGGGKPGHTVERAETSSHCQHGDAAVAITNASRAEKAVRIPLSDPVARQAAHRF